MPAVTSFGRSTRTGPERPEEAILNASFDAPRELRNVLDHNVPLGATPSDPDNISFLEGVGTDDRRRDLPAKDDQRHTIAQGILHGSDDVWALLGWREQDLLVSLKSFRQALYPQ